jgi:hypothetical protein
MHGYSRPKEGSRQVFEFLICFYSRKIIVLYVYNAKPPPLDYVSGIYLAISLSLLASITGL